MNDLGPLAWVLDEVRASLEASSKALKRFVRDAAQTRGKDMASIDSSQLRLAKQQLRQVVGALEMVDLEKPALVLRAMEAAVERFILNPELCSETSATALEKAGFALTAYLEGMLAGRKISAVALFPQYAEVQQLAGSARIHPADLWEQKWRWASVAAPSGVAALALTAAVRAQMDAPVLQVMRTLDAQAASTLEATAAGISLDAAASSQQATLWRLAAAFFDLIAHAALAADLHVKRAATGVLLQATEQIKDAQSVNARLAQDLLFFVANAKIQAPLPESVAAILQAYGLQDYKAVDYSKRIFGHYDPAMLVQARKRIAAVKETWSLVTAGESNKYQLVKDQIQAIAESIEKLFPAGQDLANSLLAVADAVVRQARPPETNVAMEVATSLLYAEAVLEDADLNNPDLETRTQRLAERIANAQQGGVAHPLDPWMEELYRNVSDRQNMGSVVGELKVALGELEKLMDQFFRNTEDLTPLLQVPDKLGQMRGVMSILGLDAAIKAVQWMREHIEQMAIQSVSVQEAQASGVFEKVGTNLGALGFLIDMLSYQPALAKKLFIYDAQLSELKPLMGRAAKQEDTTDAALSAEAEMDFGSADTAAAPLETPASLASTVPLEQTVSDQPLTNASPTLFDATVKLPVYDANAEAAAQPHAAPLILDEPPLLPETAIEAASSNHEHEADHSFDLTIDEDTPAHPELAAAAASAAPIATMTVAPSAATHSTVVASSSTPVASNSDLDGLDDELLEIFLEEAREVVTQGLGAIENLRAEHGNNAELTTLRRSFHTLKGSSRMVGLNTFGESAWAMEQVLNTWLADSKPASDSMLDLSEQAMQAFGDWVNRIGSSRSDGPYHAQPFQHSSEAMRSAEHTLIPLNFSTGDVTTHQTTATVEAVDALEGFDLGQVEHVSAAALELPESSAEVSSISAHETESPACEFVTQEGTEPAPVKLPSLDEVLSQQESQAAHAAEAAAPLSEPDWASLPMETVEMVDAPAELPVLAAVETPASVTPTVVDEEDQYKAIGDLRINIALFNVFLGEADDWSRRLVTEITEWALDPAQEVSDSPVALAHSLAGTSGTVGHSALSGFARTLEHCLARDRNLGAEAQAHRFASIYAAAAEEIRRILHQFAAGILSEPHEEIAQRLHAALEGDDDDAGLPSARMHIEDLLMAQSDAGGHAAAHETPHEAVVSFEPSAAGQVEFVALDEQMPVEHTASHAQTGEAAAGTTGAAVADAIDEDLFPIFEEEANDLLPELGSSLRQWHAAPDDAGARASVLRVLHTLKGSARLAGAMRLGEMVHHMESSIEMMGAEGVPAHEIDQLLGVCDDITEVFDRLRAGERNIAVSQHASLHQNQHQQAEDTETAVEAPVAHLAESVSVSTFDEPSVEIQSPVASASFADAEPASDFVASTLHAPLENYPHHLNDERLDTSDSIDENLFPIFEDEAKELLPELSASLRQWQSNVTDTAARASVLRVLHTLKGSARLAGAMRLGEMTHHMESAIEMLGADNVPVVEIENLLGTNDEINYAFDQLCQHFHQKEASESLSAAGAASQAEFTAQPNTTFTASVEPTFAEPTSASVETEAAQKHADDSVATLAATAVALDTVDLTGDSVAGAEQPHAEIAEVAATAEVGGGLPSSPEPDLPALPARQTYVLRSSETSSQTVRVRSHLLDLLVNLAGEVMITRAKLENELGVQLRTAANDLASNLDRLREQLRDIEVQAESQMQSRLASSKETSQTFDPLEFDRFTRVQELTRMMAESVNDVATVHRNVQNVLDATDGALIAQARQTRELQRYLLRTRMVEFDSISDRLYRVIRQAAKDAGKQVKLDIVGASIELDRGVLERMTPAFEHLLRNCVAHGIEAAAERSAAGKDATGVIAIHISQEGNDVAIEFKDDGAGLNVARILEKAQEKGLITKDSVLSDQEIFNLIYAPGFSTAAEVTTLAGRGVGMDVVKNEVQALGGRIETHSVRYKGTNFKLVLPLTTAVTQVVMVRAGHLTFGIPANLMEVVRRATAKELEQAYAEHAISYAGERLPFQWAGALLQASAASVDPVGRSVPVIIVRSAAQRVAVHVDEVLGNQEVVVKNLGPQLSHLPGLAGMSVLASGAVVLIYNPVALHTVYHERAAEYVKQSHLSAQSAQAAADTRIPLVMVVDDSVTVRRVTQRLLQREGYRVLLANDGLMALEKLGDGEELPSVILSDIEMPRMDGFDLVRNIRAQERLKDLPVVMITSRMAEKHREHAMSLGANHYLGKPYGEEELLGIIQSYTQAEAPAQ